MSNLNIKFKRLTPFKRCVLQNFPFIEEDFDALTNYGLLCKIVEYLNKVIASQNEVIGVTQEIIDGFNNLYNYVNDYFKNLDVQEEINNKLDQMAEDGTLEQIVEHYINFPPKVKFHSVAGSSATYIVEFPNGKNMIIDSGTSAQWQAIKDAIDYLGITKFDYAVTSHFHSDHYGNNENLIDTYDFSDCKWWIQMKPDYTNHSADIQDSETAYNNQVAILRNKGIDPIVPTNNSVEVIDDANQIELRFLNTSSEIAENYYDRLPEWHPDEKIGFNDFSLIVEIKHKGVKILTTGDIEEPVEEQYADMLSKQNLVVAPHHGINQSADRKFYYTVHPDYAICSYATSSTNWVRPYYKEFGYLKQVGACIVGTNFTIPTNGLFTFISDGYNLTSECKGNAITDDVYNINNMYQNFESLVDYTKQTTEDITLDEMLANLPDGFSFTDLFTSSSATKFVQAYSDLQTIFPRFQTGTYMTITHGSYYHSIRFFNQKQDVTYYRYLGLDHWNVQRGSETIGTINGTTNLINLINALPIGHYSVQTFVAENDSTQLQPSGQYMLSIDIPTKSDTLTLANVSAVLKDLTAHTSDYICAATAYVRTDQSPYIVWRKTG